jgi:putative serine protease PepD
VVTAIVIVLALLASGVFVGRYVVDGSSDDATAASSGDTQTGTALPTDPPVQGDQAEPVAAVADAVAPAVVQIETGFGLGSGIAYDPTGLILTNAHVVGDETDVTVTFSDGSSSEGEVLGTDPSVDVAVVQVDVGALVDVAVLALDDEPQVGQLAVAVGSPFGLEQTVTAGIVSAVDRPFPNDLGIIVPMLQTDAAINSGNSGGALADRDGRIIGMNTAIFSNSGDNSGIGFSIPIDKAFAQATKIVNGESLDAPLLGVTGQPPESGEPGAEIIEVTADTAADQAGLLVGDIVVTVDGDDVKSFQDLAAKLGDNNPGDTVSLEIQRAGEEITVEVTLGSR